MVSRAQIVFHFVIYGLIVIQNEIRTYGVLCYITAFLLGAQDNMTVT